MKPEIKKAWVEALRSGEFKQGKQYLAFSVPDGATTYCCLGVLSELAAREDVCVRLNNPAGPIVYGDSTSFPPHSVESWAGIDIERGFKVKTPGGPEWLTELNDENDWTFEQIADAIEADDDF